VCGLKMIPNHFQVESTFSQMDGVEANLACGLPLVLTKYAELSIGSFELSPGPGIFAIFDFHKMDVPLAA